MQPETYNPRINETIKLKNKLLIVVSVFVVLLVACLVTFLEIDRRSFKEVTTNTSAASSNSNSSKSSGGIQGKGQDSESRTDISAIHSQIEAYYAQNGSYPGFSQMNNQAFIEQNFVGLSLDSLKTPEGISRTFTEIPTDQNYGYKTSNCNKSGLECQTYTLSALLNTGEVYTKQSLN